MIYVSGKKECTRAFKVEEDREVEIQPMEIIGGKAVYALDRGKYKVFKCGTWRIYEIGDGKVVVFDVVK